MSFLYKLIGNKLIFYNITRKGTFSMANKEKLMLIN